MDSRTSSTAGRRAVQLVLRGGLLLGSVLMAIGVVLALFEGRSRAHVVRLSDIRGLIAGGHPSGIVALGVVLLVATPVARVLALVITFAHQRDRRFALVALAVAVLLAIGVALGRA